jgi:predicted site-specific integrase-resolvase
MVKATPDVKPGYYYNKSETAEFLGISRTTLRKYTRLKRIKSTTIPNTDTEVYAAEDILDVWNRRIGERVLLPFNNQVSLNGTLENRIYQFKSRNRKRV